MGVNTRGKKKVRGRAAQLIQNAIWPNAVSKVGFVKGEMCVSKYRFNLNIVVMQSCPGLHIFLQT